MWTRRKFFGTLVAMGVYSLTAHTQNTSFALMGETLAEAGGREMAINALRYVNTLLLRHRTQLKSSTYCELRDLMSSPALDIFRNGTGMVSRAGREVNFLDSDNLVPGFKARYRRTANRKGYTLRLHEIDSEYVVFTTQEGIIYEASALHPLEAANQNSVRPIDERYGIPKLTPRLKRIGALLSGVAYGGKLKRIDNSESCNACGSCVDTAFCVNVCWTGCCNAGYENCPWCCQKWAGCFCS